MPDLCSSVGNHLDKNGLKQSFCSYVIHFYSSISECSITVKKTIYDTSIITESQKNSWTKSTLMLMDLKLNFLKRRYNNLKKENLIV